MDNDNIQNNQSKTEERGLFDWDSQENRNKCKLFL
jgi:hypothetical protein